MTNGAPAHFDPHAGPARATIGADAVLVWRSRTDHAPEPLARCHAALPESEQARAGRLRFADKRAEYVVAQALLRTVLGHALGEVPERIRFDRGPKGKPYLAAPWSRARIQFNVTHTAGQVMVAAIRDREIGVDCERVRDDVDADRIVERHFTREERSSYFALPVHERRAAFFRGWTRKEALLKALGAGIGGGLASFSVTLDDGDDARVLAADARYGGAGDWTIAPLDAGPGYAAAIAARGGAALRATTVPG